MFNMLELLLSEVTFKGILLGLVVFISFALQCALLISLYRNRGTINFLSCIKRGNRVSKAGLFFFVLMGIIAYQGVFKDQVDINLVALMVSIIGGDLGATWLKNKKELDDMEHEHKVRKYENEEERRKEEEN